ncbi:MAG: M48 family metallopeptidase [Clostridiales Family XIII bacterium]|jgi:predicted metal-dependent hydrolase|nr:M48 family metallopeptidase [Clostridiales Family XIII bacterium]
MGYRLIRSRRKSVAVYVREGGALEVRAPMKTPVWRIDAFLEAKAGWIEERRAKLRTEDERREIVCLGGDDIKRHRRALLEYLDGKLPGYAALLGVGYGRVRVGGASKRWASCTSDGNLSFSYRMALLDPGLIDYIVVHELAHRREMNHSAEFWKIVEGVLPDFRERRKALRTFSRRVKIVETEKI